ncbi:MAG: hypothetical protein COV47_01510 [Candidatus Diapherotrites archaeon CG11_big_fil_rev_8_21_14_0_20_37_9]|nr:MAG: hypothetical protein COV47_01510 [Candidatus Diapherotrites archaeon CG11_big_fil_rev_8_21_14_0_20_37_9]
MAKVDFSGLIGGKKSTISKRDSEKSEKAEKKKKKESTEPKETEPISEPAETEIQQKREKNEISESEPKEPEKVVAEEIESESGFDPAKVEAAISNKTKAGKKAKPVDKKELIFDDLQKKLRENLKKNFKKEISAEEKKFSEKKLGEKDIERMHTGVEGLDPLIEGGFEQGSNILVVGSAGSGKTILGIQFLAHGAMDYKEPGIYITFEETRDSVMKHTLGFDFQLEKLEKEGLFKVLEYKPHQVEKLVKEGGGPIRDAIKAMGAKRAVLDSITAYSLLFRDEYQKRESVVDLLSSLKKWGCTSIIISETPPKVLEEAEGNIAYFTDAVVAIYYAKQKQTDERVHSMEILKMRGTKHTDNLLAIQFEETGIVIYSDVEVFTNF